MDTDIVEVEVPGYFICPISLDIMKDPVTAITGITYDRESIERWLFDTTSATSTPHCPVTNQNLPRDSDLTPNHTLRRLIQSWCTQNASRGVDRIPTPRAPLERFRALNLIIMDPRDPHSASDRISDTLRHMESLAAGSERNRTHMAQAGTPEAVVRYVVACFKGSRTSGLKEALSILNLVRIPPTEARAFLLAHDQIIDTFAWTLQCATENCNVNAIISRSDAISVLKRMIDAASSSVLERLNTDIFRVILSIIRDCRGDSARQGLNAVLHIMLISCQWGRNRFAMIEYGAVFELIELELTAPENRTTELILGILFHLCSCADGRAKLVSHKGGIAVISKRILHVSPAADDRAILILSVVSKFSGTASVVNDMLMVGAVSKLCMVIRSESALYLKDKAREILRSHSEEWKSFPCIKNAANLTKFFR